jgi:hypothetical protein
MTRRAVLELLMSGRRPSLDLNFMNGVLDGRITASGGANGTRVNSAGVIVSASCPRFNYNPVTLASRGLLIEEARTNLCLHSGDISNATDWPTVLRASVGAPITAPDGGSTGYKLIEDSTAANTHLVASIDQTLANTTVYTYSVYAKAGQRTQFNMQIGTGAGAYGATVPFAYFDLTNVSVLSSGSGTAAIAAVGGGWYRCTFIAIATTSASTTNMRLKMAVAGSDNYNGDGSSGMYFWGAQVEAGASVTSYIPTTTATVARTGDVPIITGASFSSWFNATLAMTLYCEYDLNQSFVAGQTWVVANLADGPGNNRLFTYLNAASITSSTNNFVSGSNIGRLDSGAGVAAGTIIKTATAVATNDRAFTANGATPTTAANGAAPSVADRLAIGGDGSSLQINGHIRAIKFYPRRLPDAELQRITA